ncbi:MAG: hypothetical protein FWG89_07830 [Treponema sp.]|nr:hypothetical protein [Treponema sp.]
MKSIWKNVFKVAAILMAVCLTFFTCTIEAGGGIAAVVDPWEGILDILALDMSLAAPAAGALPALEADPTGATALQYTADVTWEPSHTVFLEGVEYTATITIHAHPDYNLTTVAEQIIRINGLVADGEMISIVSQSAGILVLSYNFPGTAPEVYEITLNSNPIKMDYTHGETLDLSGLAAQLVFYDDTIQVIDFSEFGSYGITTTPANNALLSRAVHDGTPIVVRQGIETMLTANLIVDPRAITFVIDDIPGLAQASVGAAVEPVVAVWDGPLQLTLDTDYTVLYTNNTAPGTATASVTGIGNYDGSSGSRTYRVFAPNDITGTPISYDAAFLSQNNGFRVNINFNQEFQTMKGFGASDCWSGNFVGRWGTTWTTRSTVAGRGSIDLTSSIVNVEQTKQQMADWLFSQDFDSQGNPLGIGLSEWRVNFGSGSWEQAWEKNWNSKIGTRYGGNSNGAVRSWDNMQASWERNAESFLYDVAAPYVNSTPITTFNGTLTGTRPAAGGRIRYDWPQIERGADGVSVVSMSGRQAGQLYWMEEAKKRGVEALVGFANSPPVSWTLSRTGNNATHTSNVNSSGRYTQIFTGGNLPDGGGNALGSAPAAQNQINHYETFATYLADIAQEFGSRTITDLRGNQQSLRFNYISPVNEPQWEWNEDKQEGTQMSNANIARMTRAADAAIRGVDVSHYTRPNVNATNTKLMMPESCQWQFLYEGSATNTRDQINTFFQSSSGNYIGGLPTMQPWIMAAHTYFSHGSDSSTRSIRQSARARANLRTQPETGEPIHLWSTEWCGLDGGDGISTIAGAYFDVGLFMAKLAYADIIHAGSQTFSFWTAFDMERGGASRYSMIAYAPNQAVWNDTGHLTNPIFRPGQIKSQPTLWSMGHYSLFVRPNFKRIQINPGPGLAMSVGQYPGSGTSWQSESLTGLMATAYKSPPGYRDFIDDMPVNRIVVVYVNMLSQERVVAADFAGDVKPIRVRVFRTREQDTNNATRHTALGMRSVPVVGGGVVTIPARSLVTVVYDFPTAVNLH